MNYTTEDFHKDVITEANRIKEFATVGEISRLDVTDLSPTDIKRCIYGQMTGSCINTRAIELIGKCTQNYFSIPDEIMETGEMEIELNMGKYIWDDQSLIGFQLDRKRSLFTTISAIEIYILMPNAKIKELVSFIKRETAEIKL